MASYYDRFDKLAVYVDGKHVEDIDCISNDPNHGIPERYWDWENVDLGFVYLDTRTGYAEWIPAVGPAPCYENNNGENIDRNELFAEVEKFVRETF